VHYDGAIHDFMLLKALGQTKAMRAAIAQATASLREALGMRLTAIASFARSDPS
jgi:hypothetical protein